tara:strand:+ start:5089 stop:5328 length:240 start_codon:yes stop_codon:yes gene_type:complete
MSIKVHFSCDSIGDHNAHTSQLIDSEFKEFKDLSEAIIFATECTEVLNPMDLLEEAGVPEEVCRTSFREENLLVIGECL